MIGCSTCSDDHIRESKLQWNLALFATDTVSEVSAELERKIEKNNIHKLENDEHSRCHSEWHTQMMNLV